MSDDNVKTTFDLFTNGGKKVPANEVPTIVRAQNLSPTEEELQKAIADAGIQGDADLKQVSAVVKALQATKNRDMENTIRSALKIFDQDGGDMVTVSELSHALSTLGDKMTNDDIDEIFRQADVDSFGQISIDDFAKMITAAAREAFVFVDQKYMPSDV